MNTASYSPNLNSIERLWKVMNEHARNNRFFRTANEKGGLLAVKVIPGNTDDRAPVSKMANNIKGKLFGDKGYLSKKLFEGLLSKGLHLITTVKKKGLK